MRRYRLLITASVVIACQFLAGQSEAQRVQVPTPLAQFPTTPAYQQPASTYPYTTPGTVAAPPPSYPPALPPAAQPQAMQNLVGDTQRYGLPFDPYAQPAQYVAPPVPPPAAVPYATTAAPPPIAFPAWPASWGGFYAGFEATVLEARTGGASFGASTLTLDSAPVFNGSSTPQLNSFDFQPDFDFEFSPRVWIGYKGAAGFGVRGRWWWYDHSGAGNFDIESLPEGTAVDLDNDGLLDDSLALSLHSNLKFNVLDLEGTQDGEFQNWDFQVCGGVRFADINYDLKGKMVGTIDHLPAPDDFDGALSANSEFSGVGPTIGFSARRPLFYVDGLAFLMNLRTAFLFGNSTAKFHTSGTGVTITGLPQNVDFEDSIQSWEAQVGFEYSRSLASGARLFGGAYLEGQIWDWGFPTGTTGNDIGFFGPTFTVGIAR